MKRLIGATLALLAWTATVAADDPARALDTAIQRATGGGLWGAVLVARAGEILLAKGYGFADYATTPNRPETLFEIASTSKQFTAAAILRLEQDGKLSTDAPLAMFFEGVPPDKQSITIVHLLNHTSGISAQSGVPYASPISREAFVKKVMAEPLRSRPGEKFVYCNVGYALLAAIVEIVSGRSFEDYLADEIFARAGLESTGLIGDRTLIESGRDSARLMKVDQGWTAANWHWGWGYRGMGGVVTTVHDLHRWDRALRGDDVLDVEARRKLYDPAHARYGLGWFVQTTTRGTTKVYHGGRVAGFGCRYVRYLEEDVVIAILSNGTQDLGEVESAIIDVLFPRPKVKAWIDVTPFELNDVRAAMLSHHLEFDVHREGESVRVSLRQHEHVALSILAPLEDVNTIIRSLEDAIAARAQDVTQPASALEAGLYLHVYAEGTKRLELSEGIEIVVLPKYVGRGEDGRPVEDKRVILVVQDTGRHFWASIVKMNPNTVQDLLEQLRGAVQ